MAWYYGETSIRLDHVTSNYLLAIFALSYLLSKTSDLTAHSLRRLRFRLRVNEFVASFFFLGLATSIPEFAVAVFAAIRAVPELSLGNLLGANIVVLTLMLGIAAILAGGISVRGQLRQPDFLVVLIVTGLPIIVTFNGFVSRAEGLILVLAYVYLMWRFYQQRSYYQGRFRTPPALTSSWRKDAQVFVVAITALLSISYLLVFVSLKVAAALTIPVLLVGLLMISLGTNVPEISFIIKRVSGRQAKGRNIASGILFGNVAANTPALGVLALLHPFTIANQVSIWVTTAFLVLVLVVVGVMMLSGRSLNRREGSVLLVIYGLFIAYHLGWLAA